MISQFFVLSDRGDRIILKDFRFDTPSTSCEKFVRAVRSWPKGSAPPIFNHGAVTYVYQKNSGLYFVVTTRMNASPAIMVELLNRILKIIKDYCGMLSEEAIRKNTTLIYELLDEAIDFGYPQDTNTEVLSTYIYNRPVVVEDPKAKVIGDVNKSVLANKDPKKKGANELYVDVIERLNIMTNSQGFVLSQSIDGSIAMRSYLSGCPPVKMQLSRNTIIGKDTPLPPPTTPEQEWLVLDDINFHECMNLEKWDEDRMLSFRPPEGEFTACNYRITTEFKPPFEIHPMVEEKSETKIEVIVKLVAAFEADVEASDVLINMHAPHDTTTCSIFLDPNASGQIKEYREKERRVLWMVSKVQGTKEYFLRVIFNLAKPATQFIMKEISPIAITFTLPNFQVSGLRITGLGIDAPDKDYKPQRLIRYITKANSYCCRL